MRTLRRALAVLLSLSLVVLAPGDGARAAAAVFRGPVKTARVPVLRLGVPSATASSLKPGLGLGATLSLGRSQLVAAPSATAGASLAAQPVSASLLARLAARLPEVSRLSAGSARAALERDFLRRLGGPRLLSEDESPEPVGEDAVSGAGALKKAESKPFVVPMVVIERLRKLDQEDPEKGFAAALEVMKDPGELRYEVKITALRILLARPSEKVLPVLLELLAALHSPAAGVETAPTASAAEPVPGPARWFSSFRGAFKSPLPQPAVITLPDLTWALRRELLKAFGRRAGEAGALKDALVAAARRSRAEDRSVPVRIMAGWTLEKLGADPGPEIDPRTSRPRDSSIFRKKSLEDLKRDQELPKPARPIPMGKAIAVVAGVMLLFALTFGTFTGDSRAAQERARTEQVDSARIHRADSLKAAAKADSLRLETMTPEQSLRELSKDIKQMKDVVVGNHKRSVEAEQSWSNGWVGMILRTFLMLGVLVALMFFVFPKLMNGGAFQGASKTAEDQGSRQKARFTDVAGIDETLIELQEVVDMVKNPGRYRRLGAKPPKGALLYGPPGTGKTLIAKAVAGEAGVNFFSMSGSEFVEMFVGVGARRVRDLFAQARAKKPAIIFIDEIDAIGGKRGLHANRDGGSDEKEGTLNQLLKEMDGFEGAEGVFVIGATNLKDKLDKALLRKGRFDRHVLVDLPEALGREAIGQLYAGRGYFGDGLRLSPDADLEYLAQRTSGLAGANIEGIVNEAAMLAARRGSDLVENSDLDEAVDRDTIGATVHRALPPETKRRVALHEAGHVLANLTSSNPGVPNKVTILPKGSGALGFAETGDQGGDRYLYTTSELDARIDTALGGLVAEELFYEDWSTGPASDLKQANRIMRYMVEKLGMSAELGFAQAGADEDNPYAPPAVSDATKAKADAEVRRGLQESYERVKKRLTANKEKLQALADALREKETLTKTMILEVVGELDKP